MGKKPPYVDWSLVPRPNPEDTSDAAVVLGVMLGALILVVTILIGMSPIKFF